jgi:CRP-like cAMP-binding protein
MIMILQSPLHSLFAESRVMRLPTGAPIFLSGRQVETMFLVLSGRAQLQRHTPNGARLILQNAGPGAVLAEASAYSEHYHCDAVAVEPAMLAPLPKPAFLAALRDAPDLAAAWSAMLARSVQSARVRAEIRSLPRLADRLDAWFAEGAALPEKGRWHEVAAELSVNREALYRELARRRGRLGHSRTENSRPSPNGNSKEA